MKLGQIVQELRTALGWNLEELAARASAHGKKVNWQSIQQLELKPDMAPRYLRQLAKAFGKSIDDLLAWRTGMPTYGSNAAIGVQDSAQVARYDAGAIQSPLPRLSRVPIKGTAFMSADGFWKELEDIPSENWFVEATSDDPGAYAVQIRGDYLFPSIRAGWFVMVEPSLPIHVGEFVLLKLRDGRSTVRELLWHKDGVYTLEAPNGGSRLSVREADVEYIHPVTGTLAPSKRRN